MTPEEVTRRNEAIANYMKWPKNDACEWNPIPCNTYAGGDLRFHTDWGWLMPVVEKMIDENSSDCVLCGPGYASYIDDGFVVDFFSDKRAQYQSQGKGNTLIEATWMAVSEWVLSRETQNSGDGKEA